MFKYKSSFIFLLIMFVQLFACVKAQNYPFPDGKVPEGYQPDTRIDHIGYWVRMAELGLVPQTPPQTPVPAIYTGSAINAPTSITTDSPDVPVTEENSTQSENSIFVDPEDIATSLNSNNSTQNPVGMLYGADYFYTHDGGDAWDGSIQGAGGTNSGDPAAAIGTNGHYFVGYINNGSGQTVARSVDGGQSWTYVQVAAKPPGFGSLLDKNHLWIDNSPDSPYEGNLYSVWTCFGGADDGDVDLSVSQDDGQTWSSPVNVSSAVGGSNCQGVNIHTGPEGQVYTAFAVYDGGGDEHAIGFAKSVTGGLSFQPAIRAINNIKGIRSSGTSKNMRVNSFPSMTVDISGGPNNGNIYIVWANIGVPGVNTGPDIDVYMIKSTNEGSTWSSPVRINQDPSGQGKEHFFPWITCDPETGTLSVIFYDDRDVAGNQCEVWVANSTNGGATWDNFKVSDVSFTPQPIPGLAANYFGDYLGISAKGGIVYPCWTDNRTGVAMSYVSPYETPAAPRKASDPSPADNAINQYPWASLHWKDFRNRSSYFELYLGTNNPPTNILNGLNVTDTFYIPTNDFDFDQQYFWRVNSFNAYGQTTGDIWTFTTGAQPDEDFETGDFSKNDWTFGGDADWVIDNTVYRNGTYSAKSGSILDNQSTSLIIQLNVVPSPFASQISFWKKVSSQLGGDKLQFLIDDELQQEWSGEEDWSYEAFTVSTGGEHTFEWKYIKNDSGSSGYDAAWIDYIDFPPLQQLSANAGSNATICEDNTCQLSGSATYYTSLLWSTSGDGTFDDDTILNPVYTPGQQDIAGGTVTLTLTAYNGTDSVSDDMILTIQPLPVVTLEETANICNFDTYQPQNVQAVNYSSLLWTSSGDGSFDDNTLLDPIYTPGTDDIINGQVILTLLAYGLLPCGNASAAATLTIATVPDPALMPEGPADLCQNPGSSEYTTYSVPGATGYGWQLDPATAGTLDFSDTTASVQWDATFSGSADLKVITVNDCGEGDPSEPLVILVHPIPGQAATPAGPDTVCTNLTSTSEYETAGAADALSYLWQIMPPEAGMITGTGTIGTVTWNVWTGTAMISVKGLNDCGEGTSSEIYTVTAEICVGIGNPLADNTSFRIYPNPGNGIFTLDVTTEENTVVDIKVLNPLNTAVYEKKYLPLRGKKTLTFDLTHQPDGIYFLLIENGNNRIVRKIVIQK